MSHFSSKLVFVDESELSAGRIKKDLMYHMISSLTVFYHSVESYMIYNLVYVIMILTDKEKNNHKWKHDRIAFIERVFLNAIEKQPQRNDIP